MSWLNNLSDAWKRARSGGRETFSAAFPYYDAGSAFFPSANPYILAQEGFSKNELVYSCINAIANAISEAPLWEYDDSEETPAEIPHSPLRDLLEHPAPNLTEEEFWKITEITLKTAGFCVWEKVRPNVGSGITELGYLRSDWVSFRRGRDKAIGAVAYSPPGVDLEPKPAEEFIIFQYFDPRNPFVKGLSPMAIALRTASVDNSATDFLKNFFSHGAVFNGILTSEMNLNEQEAKRIKDGWKIAHGGVQNWADIAVLGKNVKYQQTQMDFDKMAFSALDQRSEARILTVFNVPLQIIGTTIGAQSSTYANYQEAKLSFYQSNIKPEWRYLAGVVREQLLPKFHAGDAKQFFVEFHTADIQALEPNRSEAALRAEKMFVSKLWSRDEAREETDMDSIDGDWNVFADGSRMPKPGVEGTPAPHPILDQPKAETPAPTQPPSATPPAEPVAPVAVLPAVEAAKALERKQYKTFIAHGRDPSKFHFDWLTDDEQKELYSGNGNGNGHGAADDMREQFSKATQEFREAMKAGTLAPMDAPKTEYNIPFTINVPPPIVNITNQMPMQDAPTVNIPAPIVNVAAPNVQVDNHVNPTPIEIMNQVDSAIVNVTNRVETPMIVNRIEQPATPPAPPEPRTRNVKVKRGADGKIAGFEEVVE